MDPRSRTNLRKLLHRLGAITAPAAVFTTSVRRWIFESSPNVNADGILIVDLNFDRTDDSQFKRTMTDALELIRDNDLRRYMMVKQEIRYLVNSELNSWGQYERHLRVCSVDFGRLIAQPGDVYHWYVAAYAGLIVHEATHGRLEGLGFPYTRTTRTRIERICRAEERRFLRRLPLPEGEADRIAPPFREQDWHPTWYGSRVELTRALFARIRQSRERETLQGAATAPAQKPS